MRIEFTLKKWPYAAAYLLALLAVSILLLARVVTKSPSLGVQFSKLPSALTDSRFFGLSEGGWSQPNFDFNETRILAYGSKVELYISPDRPAPNDIASIDFTFNQQTVSAIANGATVILLPGTESRNQPISISAEIKNPYAAADGQLLGVRLLALRIVPTGRFLLPSLDFVAPIVASLAGLILAIFLFGTQLGFVWRMFLPILVLPLEYYTLRGAYLDFWPQACWLFATLMLLFLGAHIALRLGAKNENKARLEKKNYWPAIIAIVVLLFAFWVRYEGIRFGHPALYHPDEARKLQVSQRILNSTDLNPKYFRHPNFLVYGMAGMAKLYSYATSTPIHPLLLSLCGRLLSLIAGVVACLMTFLIGKKLYGNYAGLCALGIAAASPLLVVTSRYSKEDSLLICFTLITLYFAIKALTETKQRRDLLLSALFAGVAASSKYSGLVTLAFPGFVLIIWTLQRLFKTTQENTPEFLRQILPWSFIVLLLFALGFVAITPYSLITPTKFLADFNYERMHMERGHAGAISAAQFFWTYHLHYSALPALFWPAFIAGVAGLGFVLFRRRPSDILIVIAFLIFYLPAEWVKAKPEPQPERYIVPCIAFLAIASGALLSQLIAALNQEARLRSATKLLMFLIIAAPIASFSYGHALAIRHDTRVEASKWVEANIPQGSKVLIDWHFYGPEISKNTYNVLELKVGEGATLQEKLSLETLKAAEVKYVVLSELYYRRFLKPANRFHRLSWRFKKVMSQLTLIKEFSGEPYSYGFHNPTIKVFSVP